MYCCRDGKFVEVGNQFWLADDVTLGYIIGENGVTITRNVTWTYSNQM
jgi:hypothetical protein